MRASDPPIEPLTPKEREVLQRLRDGLSNRLIAHELGVGEQTVKYHLKNIYGKLGATGRAHAVALTTHQPPRAVAAATRQDEPAGPSSTEPPLSPLTLARRTRRLFGDRPAVVDGGLRLTYEQLFARCDRASGGLRHLGLAEGDRVATIALNTHAHLELFIAVPQARGVIVPLNPRLAAAELARMILHAGARVVCVGREFVGIVDALRTTLDGVEHFVSLDAPRPGWIDYETLLGCAGDAPAALAPSDERSMLALNYTSGTVHEPRGVMISHRSAWMNTVACQLHWPLTSADRFLWHLPFSHGNGWGFVWTVTAAAATHVCSRTVNIEALPQALREHRVTALCAGRSALLGIVGLPQTVRSLLPRSMRLLTAGAAPAPSTLERVEVELGWEVTHAYGLTETAVFVAFREFGAAPGTTSSERARWRALQGVEPATACELRVVDEESEDVPRDGATIGEVIVRAGTLMLGYFRNPEATRRALLGGWFRTGDAAVMLADGSIQIKDRFKDLIISDDQLIAPIEIESALMAQADVQDVAVVGTPHPVLGEAVHAFVVLRDGAQASPRTLLEGLRKDLATFKWPQRIDIVRELPRTASGKLIKHQLRGAYSDE